MKIPKYFEDWFYSFGLLDENIYSYHDVLCAKRIAWRAYRKGKKDERQKQHEKVSSE
jgi:hypothetical protein